VVAFLVRALSAGDMHVRRAAAYALHHVLDTHAPQHRFRESQEVWTARGPPPFPRPGRQGKLVHAY
jgi:hypothetical protein